MTKFIRRILPMFNNETFLALSENLSQRIFNKDKKHKKQKAATLKKILKTIYLAKASRRGM